MEGSRRFGRSSRWPDGLLKLVRRRGEVNIPATLELWKNYEGYQKEYLASVRRFLKNADVAIDIGVPLFARSARELGVPRRITVFDHSWAATLKLACLKKWGKLYTEVPRPTRSEPQRSGPAGEGHFRGRKSNRRVVFVSTVFNAAGICQALAEAWV